MKFENAPLIELIAEVRWGSPSVGFPLPINMSVSHANVSTNMDSFVTAFAKNVADAGYTLSERLIPVGVPTVAFQPSHRFRRATSESGTSLFGIGTGFFSANITPPYQTWESFRPVVEMGIDALLKSRLPDAVNQPFATVALRYVNVFGSDLMAGKSVDEFLETLGFRLALPTVLSEMLDVGRPVKPMLLLNLPIEDQRMLNVNVGHAIVNGQESVLMDNSVVTSNPIVPTVGAVMHELDAAREVIHRFFVAATDPIAHLLKPTEV